MKPYLFLILITLTSKFSLSQTSQEEYNYVTKGYKVQIESGLDMKKGYEFEDVDQIKQSSGNGNTLREASLKILYRITPNKPKKIAAYMIIYQRAGKAKEYICIPNPNSEQSILDAYFKALYPDFADNSERLQLIAYLISRSLKW